MNLFLRQHEKMEYRGVEPLASTMRMLRAPNCANTPYQYYITYFFRRKEKFLKKIRVQNGQKILKTLTACYLGFITQTIAANFAPLLFLRFRIMRGSRADRTCISTRPAVRASGRYYRECRHLRGWKRLDRSTVQPDCRGLSF